MSTYQCYTTEQNDTLSSNKRLIAHIPWVMVGFYGTLLHPWWCVEGPNPVQVLWLSHRPPQLQWVHGCHGSVMCRRRLHSAHLIFWLLHSFCPLSCGVPWASRGWQSSSLRPPSLKTLLLGSLKGIFEPEEELSKGRGCTMMLIVWRDRLSLVNWTEEKCF